MSQLVFHVIGTSFRETPIELREKLALSRERYVSAHNAILSLPGVADVVLISTCNRVEIYYTTASDRDLEERVVSSFIACFPGLTPGVIKHYSVRGTDAYRHLYKVVSALDSLVIGEPQITGQMKSGFREACLAAPTSGFMKRTFHNAFRVAKKVRMETNISKMAVSMSYVVVELAKRIFNELTTKTVLVIGSGEMAELAIDNLLNAGCKKILIANRTFDNAALLAKKYKASAISLDKLPDFLPQADVVISSTGSRDFIVTKPMVKRAMKSHKGGPMFFIDIAVPRDIDPAIEEIENTFVYNVDDLEKIVKENLGSREKEAEKAMAIVNHEAELFAKSIREASSGPYIRALRQKFNDTANKSILGAVDKSQDFTPAQKERIHALTRQLIGRLLHEPIHAIRGKAGEEDLEALITVSDIFQLKPEEESNQAKSEGNIIPFPHARDRKKG